MRSFSTDVAEFFSEKLLPPTGIYLSICWFVNRIAQKVTGGFGWNFQGRSDLARLRGGEILVVIWIQNRVEGFFLFLYSCQIGQTFAEYRATTWW